MAKKPYKYRQARKDAKAAAKKAFPGKVKAVRKDITGKITAEDRLALKDMADTAKKELGKKAYLSRAEYDAMQQKELDKFRQSMADEFGSYAGKKAGGEEAPAKKAPAKKAAVKKAAVLEKKAPVKKAASVKKPVAKPAPATEPVKKAAPAKSMTRAERSAANKAAWAKMTPAERKNWQASKPTAKPIKPRNTETPAKPIPKTAKGRANYGKYGTADEYAIEKNLEKEAKSAKATKRPTLADLKKNEAAYLRQTKARLNAPAKPSSGYKANPTPPKKAVSKPTAGQAALKDIEAKAKAKAAKPKFRKIKGAGKAGLYGALAGEVVSLVKGSTKKDFNEINRLENKLASLTGKTKSAATAGRQGGQQQLSQLASLATMGIVGKTRRQRMDELNNLIAKAEAKKAKANKGLRYGPGGESLVPGTKAYAKGSKTRPATAGTSVGAGGSTTTPSTSTKYTVKKGDTFEGIAKSAGVSTKELRAANPYIMKNKKYKQGNMIWSGTKVNIPKK